MHVKEILEVRTFLIYAEGYKVEVRGLIVLKLGIKIGILIL